MMVEIRVHKKNVSPIPCRRTKYAQQKCTRTFSKRSSSEKSINAIVGSYVNNEKKNATMHETGVPCQYLSTQPGHPNSFRIIQSGPYMICMVDTDTHLTNYSPHVERYCWHEHKLAMLELVVFSPPCRVTKLNICPTSHTLRLIRIRRRS